jgi:hypothetical protein
MRALSCPALLLFVCLGSLGVLDSTEVPVQPPGQGPGGGRSGPGASPPKSGGQANRGETGKGGAAAVPESNVDRPTWIERLFAAEIIKAVSPYRHVLDFGNAVCGASLAARVSATRWPL